MAPRQWLLWCVSVVVVVVVGCAAEQGDKECQVTPSASTPGKMDVSCTCMQRLTQVDVAVATLTINRTGCARTGLKLKWASLEAEVAPSKLVLVGARVYFSEGRPAAWQPSITAIHFINCTFLEVPGHAFRGLQLLEEVLVVGGAAAVVRRGAFTGLPHLRVVEAVNASLGVLEGGAWAALPRLKDIALVHCSIGEVHSLAINLTLGGAAEEGVEACVPGRAPDRSRVLEVLSGRQLAGRAGNLSLPEFGSQLLLFQNSIEVLQPRAFTGDALGFLIMGGNSVGRLEPLALDLQLHNPCEISAALLVGNSLAGVADGALAGLRGRPGAPRHTFLALSNNTWSTAAPHAFSLHRDIALFSAHDNHFPCRCDALQWAATRAATTPSRDLQEALLAEGMCHDGSTLASFTRTCDTAPTPPSPSFVPPPPPITTPTPTPITTPTPTTTPPPSTTTPPPSTNNTTLSPSHDPSTTTFAPAPALPSAAPHPALTPATLLTLLAAYCLR